MGLRLVHLDEPDVRAQVVSGWLEEREELLAAGAREECYGALLSEAGWRVLDSAMPEALGYRDDEWLVRQLAPAHLWRPGCARIDPEWASRMLAVTEFNTAYVRGLARALMRRGEYHCTVYGAGPAGESCEECRGWEGEWFDLELVLEGHRARYFPAPGHGGWFSVPSGPHCRHSIMSTGARLNGGFRPGRSTEVRVRARRVLGWR